MIKNRKLTSSQSFELKEVNGVMHLYLLKNLDLPYVVSEIWDNALVEIQKLSPPHLVVDASQVKSCNGMGIALLYKLKTLQTQENNTIEIKGLQPKYQSLLDDFTQLNFNSGVNDKQELSNIEFFGRELETQIENTQHLIEYIGEISVNFFSSLKNPKLIRWKEVLKVMESTGANALGIIALIGFLLGLITSFQSAIPMQRFGAEIFVANLVALSLFRELGPLMTAIIMAGRSGSSYAAEIGTMKVSEELDALQTMGLSPIRFLIIPKILASMIVSPLLSIFFDLFGLIGSAIVLISFGYPLVTFVNQATKTVQYTDVAGGLFKAVVFGFLVASIGCLSGLQTKEGASAVGESTTKAVVIGIIVIAVADGIFAVFFYLLGI